MVKKFLKRVMLYDRRTGNIKKAVCVCGVLFGFSVSCCMAQVKQFKTDDITATIGNFIRAISTVLKIITGGLVLVGGFSVGNAFMNDKQNAGDTLKKWAIGIGISFIATAVASMTASSMGSNEKIE